MAWGGMVIQISIKHFFSPPCFPCNLLRQQFGHVAVDVIWYHQFPWHHEGQSMSTKESFELVQRPRWRRGTNDHIEAMTKQQRTTILPYWLKPTRRIAAWHAFIKDQTAPRKKKYSVCYFNASSWSTTLTQSSRMGLPRHKPLLKTMIRLEVLLKMVGVW